ncbi:MAG: response regulator transcription factor, partial [Chloroflexota bacterium]
MAGKRILVVDDDPKTAELVKLYLKREGHEVVTASDGTEALRLAQKTHPDLIVLDLMLPGMDGLEVCRTVRGESEVPIIMLTARTTEQDRLRGLDLGADDYVTKPFSPRELAARVRAVLRRTPSDAIHSGPREITHGELSLDFVKHEASLAGKPLSLSPTEFRLLSVLIGEVGRVFTREQLIIKAY